ncbi:hypothetical protein COCCADRAFT_6237 [Bipolaris zeicola 26-R-13]|uniref:Uncharacterized protein n=1 Tax=Cochliobolus carbonum (strain 26-R-13) TaxID=930089 RepID=W6Y970_COCC2|nr:uncharacterized protein COCCADRAFT_6237 [Bipolaris zeicola 26-R-13]EUC31929.1 hypothetical protein COCCADRAFT_6237 [Bipolaris zeicola 26-R-13]
MSYQSANKAIRPENGPRPSDRTAVGARFWLGITSQEKAHSKGRHGLRQVQAEENQVPRRSAKDKVQQLQQQLDRANLLLRASGIAQEPPSPSHSHRPSPRSLSSIEAEDASRLNTVVPGTSTTPTISDINYPGPIQSDGNLSNPPPLDHNQPGINHSDPSYDTFSKQARPRPHPHEHIGTSTQPIPVQFPFSPCRSSARPSATFDPIQHSSAYVLDQTDETRNIEQPASRDENHGPASYLSPCLDPGLSWITDRIGDSTYQSNASSMIGAINQKLQLQKNINKTRASDHSPELALLYRAIDDDDIDYELPTVAPDGNPNILAFMRCAIQHAQISSAILQGLMTTKARRQPLQQIAKTVHQYDQQLRTWYNNVPFAFRTKTGSDFRAQAPLGLHINHLMYIELSHHSVLAIVHCIIRHPWNINSPSDQTDTALQD